ncbi:hypothetical protein NS355_09785 [Sphingomonas yabuuchiae]|uniref:Uncharacterized protein n=1 Tax=Sphingomonas yabuuchiae TaxID=172044 RepID=A0A147IS17_9SPHN|nr:hypothetical protein NS355_09785 [Sphingomonas yabuuchiae]
MAEDRADPHPRKCAAHETKIGAANCRYGQANKAVGWFLNMGVGHRVDPDIADTVPGDCFHHALSAS